MSEVNDESSEDPWAWLHAVDHEAPPDYSSFHVIAAVLPTGESSDGRTRESIEDGDAVVEEIVAELPGDAEGDWFWILPDDAEPAANALTALLDRVRHEPDTAVVGALLVEPRRRGAGILVSDWAQTISSSGRLRPLTDPGELYQGQLEVTTALGVPMAGMLVRGDAWRFLGGFNPELPRSHQGLDLGWRANLSGYRVLADPASQIVDHSAYGDPADDLAAGMALVAGNTRAARRWLTSLRLVLTCLLAALGYLLGKDPERAGEEVRALWRWLTGRQLRHSVTERLASLPVTPAARHATNALRPARGVGARRWAEQIAARLIDWVQTFTGRGTGVSLDEMTGDDFADAGTSRYRLPLAATGLAVLGVAALVAARTAFGTGSLTAAQLLPAPQDWQALLASYLAPVPGAAGVAGAPWSGLAGILSLLTIGQPEWLVTGTFVLAAPLLLLVGPWGLAVLRYPGRLLTGIEPQLAPSAAPEPWTILVGHTLPGGPPLWISLGFFAVLWLAAAVGAGRRPGTSGRALAGAGVAALVAIGLTRIVVQVPPVTWTRPQALEWQLLLVAALVLAACAGLDGIATELQGRDLGLRHLANLGLALVCVVAMLVGAGWWVFAGQVGVARGPVGAVPAFVRNAQVSPTPGRTLALVASGDQVRWALLEGDFARLGDAERGIAFGGDAAAKQLAASVAARLVGDTADDQLLPDLVTLGVSNVTLAGGTPEQRLAISNVPGLGVGTGDDAQYVWPVPGSAIAVLATGEGRTPVGAGIAVGSGQDGRLLRLAEPADPRWVVTVGGTRLAATEGGAPGTQFAVGPLSGNLAIDLDTGSMWWAWVQLAGLVVLAILAAPSVRRRNESSGPRRIAGGAE